MQLQFFIRLFETDFFMYIYALVINNDGSTHISFTENLLQKVLYDFYSKKCITDEVSSHYEHMAVAIGSISSFINSILSKQSSPRLLI